MFGYQRKGRTNLREDLPKGCDLTEVKSQAHIGDSPIQLPPAAPISSPCMCPVFHTEPPTRQIWESAWEFLSGQGICVTTSAACCNCRLGRAPQLSKTKSDLSSAGLGARLKLTQSCSQLSCGKGCTGWHTLVLETAEVNEAIKH